MFKQDGWFTTALHIRNWVILRVFCKGQNSSWPDYGSHFDIKIGFFQEFLLKKQSPSCILFSIWLVWLDSFDSKWNSHYNRNDLARQFWQMESARKTKYFITC